MAQRDIIWWNYEEGDARLWRDDPLSACTQPAGRVTGRSTGSWRAHGGDLADGPVPHSDHAFKIRFTDNVTGTSFCC
jgi:hypothetical protein